MGGILKEGVRHLNIINYFALMIDHYLMSRSREGLDPTMYGHEAV